MQKVPHVFPIIGGRKVEQLHANIEALDIALSEEQIKHLESVVPFDPGFPAMFCVSAPLVSHLLSTGIERNLFLGKRLGLSAHYEDGGELRHVAPRSSDPSGLGDGSWCYRNGSNMG